MRPRLVLAAACAQAVAQEAPLKLENVLESVNRAFPPLLAAIEEREIAEGDLLTALGSFDLNLRIRADADQFGFYDNERVDIGLEQATQRWGANLFTGWRRGEGNFAAYDGKLETRSLGEYRAGMRLPLMRDRTIDSRRANVRKSELGRSAASLSIDQQKIVILQLAARRYWEWVAAGLRFRLAQSLLELATARDAILRDGVRLGQLPQIEVVDNERAILQRRSQIIEAERGLQQNAIDLSLFYRDAAGNPRMASVSQLPGPFPDVTALTEDRLREDIDTALQRRPEIQRFIVQRRQTEFDAALAKNQRLPGVDVLMSFAQEGGSGAVKRGPTDLRASLVFELPIQRRNAGGRLRSAEARLRQIDLREKFAREQITAEVQDAVSAVQAAYRRAKILAEEVAVTVQLQELERSRFDLGDSNLFLVNLREQAAFDAALREVSAQADYFRAYALYELAIAQALTPSGRP